MNFEKEALNMSNVYYKELDKRKKLILAIKEEDIYKLSVGRKNANIKDDVIVFIGVEHIFVLPADLNGAPEEITDEELDDMIANYDILIDFPMVKEFMDTVINALRQYTIDHRREICAEMKENYKRSMERKHKFEEERKLARKQEREAKKHTTKK